MTIQYKVMADGKEVAGDKYCCYGNVNEGFQKMDDNYINHPAFDYDLFEGIILDLGVYSDYRAETSSEQALENDKIMSELGFTDWLKGRAKYNYGKDGAVSQIHFLPNCPFYLVVAATGMYRMWANNNSFWNVYNQMKKRGLEPMYAYAAAVNCTGYQFNTKQNLDSNISIMTYGEHMPFTYQIARKEHLKHITSLTHESFNELPTMTDELHKSKYLTYNGRDRWFFGISSFDWDHLSSQSPCYHLGTRISEYSPMVLPLRKYLGYFKQMQEENNHEDGA